MKKPISGRRVNWMPTRLTMACAALLVSAASIAGAGGAAAAASGASAAVATSMPIKHLVVIYQENRSFDNFFGTYPNAANPPGEPAFHAAPGTPAVNGLSENLLHDNPNLVQPYRLDRPTGLSGDEPASPNHSYTGVQRDYDNGRVDQFVQVNGFNSVMGYYDGNTVTALWNYAQNFAMSDNNYETTFGPSRPQIINLISGQTHGATSPTPTSAIQNGTLISNLGPLNDDCGGSPVRTLQMTGKNIGDLLNAKGVTWGFFKQGFKPTSRVDGKAVCGATYTDPLTGQTGPADDAEDDPFQHYPSTANLHHLPPSSPEMIGHTDQANHQYDLSDFWQAADAGRMPAVSFLRTSGPFLSSPLEQQYYLAQTINRLEQLPSWKSTAVVVTWDESGGWYDHVMPPIVNGSQSPADAISGTGKCGDANTPVLGGYQDRCGYGARIPELVISPYARVNYVDHDRTAQPSIIRFMEDYWHLGHIGGASFDTHSGSIAGMFDFQHPSAKPLILDPVTGEPSPSAGSNS
jgi:phospholipase C